MGFFTTDPQAADKKALAEANELLSRSPGDVRTLMRVAELQQKLGQTEAAAQVYARAADRYAEEGFGLKAVAVNKVAYTLVPRPALYEREFELYLDLDLLHDAFESLKKAIDAYESQGNWDAAAAARQKLLVIDPDNAAGQVAVAEAQVAEGRLAEGIASLNKLINQLGSQPDLRERVHARVAVLRRRG
jgi:tetratricopeptide (TPR) repeat protein